MAVPNPVVNGSRSVSTESGIADVRQMDVMDFLNPAGSNSRRNSMEQPDFLNPTGSNSRRNSMEQLDFLNCPGSNARRNSMEQSIFRHGCDIDPKEDGMV